MKLYILARKDAPLGKVMAHVGHVCCNVVYLDKFIKGTNNRIFDWIKNYHQTKIILEINSEKEIMEWVNKIGWKLSPWLYGSMEDIHTKERYCLAIGPLTDEEAKELGLKKLRLFK